MQPLNKLVAFHLFTLICAITFASTIFADKPGRGETAAIGIITAEGRALAAFQFPLRDFNSDITIVILGFPSIVALLILGRFWNRPSLLFRLLK